MAPIKSPHRPFLGRLNTSVRKRRYRLSRWLAGVRGRNQAPIVCRYLGAKFRITPGELIGDEIAINRYEWRELAMMLAACRRHQPSLFIDAGANIGLYSCIVGKAGVVPKIVAFEPDRRNFAGLVDNIGRNDLSEVVDARPQAVGARAQTATLVADGSDNTGLSRIAAADPSGYPVEVVALDDAVDLTGGTLALKIDVEGHELDALRGAARLLGSNGGYAQIEAHGDTRAAETTAIMRDYGWQFLDRYGLDIRFERPGTRP